MIRKWHLQRGFQDIGYHWVIYQDGTVHMGRTESKIGAHVAGHNKNSIGVCYVGGIGADGKAVDTRTPQQKAALLTLLKVLHTKYPGATVHGHNEFANKACPCFNVGQDAEIQAIFSVTPANSQQESK